MVDFAVIMCSYTYTLKETQSLALFNYLNTEIFKRASAAVESLREHFLF